MKRLSVLLFVAISFVGCKGGGSMKPKDGPALISTTMPFEKSYEVETTYNGMVESPKIIQIKNRIDGYIEKQYFKDGSYVYKGDKLYKIDTKPLQAELDYSSAQLKLAKTEISNLEKISSKMELSYKSGGVSKQDYETSISNLEKAKSNGEMIKATMNKIKLNLSYSLITAPANGFIEKSQQNEGSFVSQSTPYLTNIYTNDYLQFTVMLPIDNRIQETKVSVNNEDFNAHIDFCDPMTEQSSGLVKCRYLFTSMKQIPINSIGKISLINKGKGLFIPQTALVQNSDGKSVFIFDKNKAISKPVKTGVWDKKDIQILSGINKSDEIIINGIANIKDNGKVTKKLDEGNNK